MWDFCILTGFENIVLKIELDRSSLAYTQIPNIEPDIRSDFTALVTLH